jgi:hypothetical protein
MTNIILTIQQGRLECQAGTPQGKQSPKRLQSDRCTHASGMITDIIIRCCNEPSQTTAETNHNPLPSWELLLNISTQP